MSICKECGGITSEYSGTPCTCPVVVPPAPTVVETTFADKMRLRMKACDVCHGTMQWQPPDMSEPAACLECFDWNKAINEVERLQRDLATLTRQRDGLVKALEDCVKIMRAYWKYVDLEVHIGAIEVANAEAALAAEEPRK